MAEGITKVEYDDPRRCQASTTTGQCPNKAMDECDFCKIHGHQQKRSIEKKKANLYRLHQWRSRINDFEGNEKAKSLTEEIGILRILLEEHINRCTSSADLLIASQQISELVIKIEKLVTSCNKLDITLGRHMDATQLMGFATKVITIISENIDDEATLQKISDSILSALGPADTL